jgi:hypothetical protein
MAQDCSCGSKVVSHSEPVSMLINNLTMHFNDRKDLLSQCVPSLFDPFQ